MQNRKQNRQMKSQKKKTSPYQIPMHKTVDLAFAYLSYDAKP